MKIGNVLGVTSAASTSTNATVEFLSASGRAPNTHSMAGAPRSLSLAIAFWVAGLAGLVEDLISVTRRSARKFVKKLIRPFRWEQTPSGHVSTGSPCEGTDAAPRAGSGWSLFCQS